MPTTFKSKHSPDIVMLSSSAQQLIKLMGHSGAIPSALRAEDISTALSHLKAGIDKLSTEESRDPQPHEPEENDETPIPFKHRAQPLISMLERALERGDHVSWAEY
ncbi:MAG: DUF1840 domain-containing protein [Gammaproteobacteria bacterium]